MAKKIILIVIAIVVLGGAYYFIYQSKNVITPGQDLVLIKVLINAQNATYTIEGKDITLVRGRAEMEIAPNSATKNITQYFGNEVIADFNGDGINDVAFILTQNAGGTGTFYYVAADLSSKDGFKGTNAIFLGDRIAPQTTEFRNGEIIVNYADRKPGEPMTATPSVGVSRYFKVSDGTLVEVQIDVQKQSGFLQGKIAIGPLCPVERIPPDPNCQPTAATYAAWPIGVYSLDQTTKIVDIKPDAGGLYKVALPAGTYIVNLEKSTPFAKSLPKTVTIKSGETTVFDINIDTGIR